MSGQINRTHTIHFPRPSLRNLVFRAGPMISSRVCTHGPVANPAASHVGSGAVHCHKSMISGQFLLVRVVLEKEVGHRYEDDKNTQFLACSE